LSCVKGSLCAAQGVVQSLERRVCACLFFLDIFDCMKLLVPKVRRGDIWLSFFCEEKENLCWYLTFFQRLHTVEIECTIISGLFITIVQASGSVMFFALR
jgi:hypothetical protein